jgi:hypothetical protein
MTAIKVVYQHIEQEDSLSVFEATIACFLDSGWTVIGFSTFVPKRIAWTRGPFCACILRSPNVKM